MWPHSAGPYMRNPTFVITLPADALAPNGARPSADTVMTTKPRVYCELLGRP